VSSPEAEQAGAGDAPRGAIHGYAVRSSIPWRFLRDLGGVDRRLEVHELDVEPRPGGEPLLEWPFREGRDFRASLYADDGRFAFWTDREGWFVADPSTPSIGLSAREHTVRREQRLWGIPTATSYLAHGDISLHSAAVEVDGRAILFPAPGRHGKTTTAAAFHRAGYRMLSEDLARIHPASQPSIFPGPALLRLRPDVHGSIDVPDVEVIAEEPDRVHVALTPSRRGTGDPVPIAAIVFLRRGEGAPVLERRPPSEAIPDLWALSLHLPTHEDRARCFQGVAGVAGSVPAWNLRRDLRFDDLDDLVELIVATCLPVR
jgi:hypothetical protein